MYINCDQEFSGVTYAALHQNLIDFASHTIFL